jgi:excisionase family DNA binding protein
MPGKKRSETALYVRLPTSASDKLKRAAEELGIPKKELVAGLVTKYVDPDSRRGLDELGALTRPRRLMALSSSEQSVGSYSFQPYDIPDVLTPAQAADLLQVEESLVVELAAVGDLPGRKLGSHWRFSREALIAWLSESAPQRNSQKGTKK